MSLTLYLYKLPLPSSIPGMFTFGVASCCGLTLDSQNTLLYPRGLLRLNVLTGIYFSSPFISYEKSDMTSLGVLEIPLNAPSPIYGALFSPILMIFSLLLYAIWLRTTSPSKTSNSNII